MNIQIPANQSDADLNQDDPGLLSHLRNYLIGGAALLLVLGGYWYYNHNAAPAAGRNARSQAAPVRVAVVQQRDMAVVERTIGTVVANSTVQVTARVQGQLTKAYFKEGQMVKAGDLLFQIDPAPFQAAYDSARWPPWPAPRATAERSASLLQAERHRAADRRPTKPGGRICRPRPMPKRRASIWNYCQIRSPVDGKTGPILMQPGNLVIGQRPAPRRWSHHQIQPIKVSFFLPQTDLPRIQARQKAGGLIATVDRSDAGGNSFSAPVDFVSNAVNATSGTIELRATFANTDAALVPGQLVNVIVRTERYSQAPPSCRMTR